MSKHHFVPQFMVREFRNADGVLWYYDESRAEKGVESRNPSSVFFQRNLNANSDKSVNVESQFNERLETPFSNLSSRIISSVRGRARYVLTTDEKILCAAFIYYQWKRYPEVLEYALGFDTGNRHDEDEVEQVRELLKSAEKSDQDFIHDVRLSVIAKANTSVMKHLVKIGFWFAKSPPAEFFIVGSNLLHRHKFQVLHPSVASVNSILMPIAYDLALCIGPKVLEGQILDIRRKTDIRAINRKISSSSSKIAGPSRNTIEKLATVKNKT